MISGNAKEQTFKDWIWARNIRDETLMNLAKNILHALIKVGLQFLINQICTHLRVS